MPPRKRTCTGPACAEKIKGRHYFCGVCLRKLSHNTRSRLFDAYRKGAGMALIEVLEECRTYLTAIKEKEEKMGSGKSDLVDVTLEYRRDKGLASAFFQGDMDDDDKEVWIWLPKSQIEVSEDPNGKTVTVTMPEWLAKDKGLV